MTVLMTVMTVLSAVMAVTVSNLDLKDHAGVLARTSRGLEMGQVLVILFHTFTSD